MGLSSFFLAVHFVLSMAAQSSHSPEQSDREATPSEEGMNFTAFFWQKSSETCQGFSGTFRLIISKIVIYKKGSKYAQGHF
jgi:hypothetical protein